MSESRKQINYSVACVIEFARRYNLSVKEAFQYSFHTLKSLRLLKKAGAVK